jgi:predicted secreted acid phosphatase
MAGLEQQAEQYLSDQAKHQNGPGGPGGPACNHPTPPAPPTPANHPGPPNPPSPPVPGPSPNPSGKCGTPAILLDVDDTTLNTYSYEIYSNFVYNPTTNANFVLAASPNVFPAVPGMPGLVSQAEADGYAILFLTGRPSSQAAATLQNLAADGYGTFQPSQLYTKDYTVDTWLAPCATTCTTDQYKTLTRQYIEQVLGYDIVANFGDQFSDLNGDFADRSFKLPNPMYFLP